jgi:hypothetical protein
MHLIAALARIGVYEEEICMRLNRPPGAASNPVPTAGTARLRDHRAGLVVRAMSVTAVAATACALWALPASAASAAPAAKHSSKTRVSVSPKTGDVGRRVKLSATVKSSGKTPTGTVTFRWGKKKLCSGKLSKGKAHCDARFSKAGTHTVKGSYGGNSTHKASSGTAKVKIVRSGTTTKITGISPNPVQDGLASVISVSVTKASGTPVPTGTVVVAPTNVEAPVPASYSCTATLHGGKGSCKVTPPVPSYGLVLYEAAYSGNAAHTRSKSTGMHTLAVKETTKTTVTPAMAGPGAVTLTATVVSQGEADISPNAGGSGTVTFYVNGAVVTGCGAVGLTDPSKGPDNVATCADTLATGSYTVTAVYSGDDVNITSKGTETLAVS